MHGLFEEARLFRAAKSAETTEARQRAALRLCCGIDLGQLDETDPALRAALAARVLRAIERERLKGARQHWSYDLNRHIALKQALDRLRAGDPDWNGAPAKPFRRRRCGVHKQKTTPEGAVPV